MANNNQRPSYFKEMKDRYKDPNFFSRLPLQDMRRNVRRIIRDIKNDAIEDQDYVYFKNNNLLSACLAEAIEGYTAATTISNALQIYIRDYLNDKNYALYRSMDKNAEMAAAGNQLLINNARATIWLSLYNMFMDIQNGYDPRAVLSNVMAYNIKDINYL